MVVVGLARRGGRGGGLGRKRRVSFGVHGKLRVPPRCYYRARGQDILTLAREQFGDGATVDTMFAILKERKEASLEDSDPDEVD